MITYWQHNLMVVKHSSLIKKNLQYLAEPHIFHTRRKVFTLHGGGIHIKKTSENARRRKSPKYLFFPEISILLLLFVYLFPWFSPKYFKSDVIFAWHQKELRCDQFWHDTNIFKGIRKNYLIKPTHFLTTFLPDKIIT